MKFIADEGVDAQIVSKLRSEGYDVLYVAEFDAGASDDDILKFANEDDRILITRDKDFGELVFRLNKIHSGIVLNRLFQLDASRKAALVLKGSISIRNSFMAPISLFSQVEFELEISNDK